MNSFRPHHARPRRLARAERLRDIAQALYLSGQGGRGRRALLLAIYYESAAGESIIHRIRRESSICGVAHVEPARPSESASGDFVLVPGVDLPHHAPFVEVSR